MALDIDGTLVNRDGKIPTGTVEALDLARSAAHEVVLATGRSLVGLLPITTRLGLTDGWAVGSNGALTVRLDPSATSRHVLDHANTFEPAALIRRTLELMPATRVAVEDVGTGWHVNQLFDAGQVNGEQKVVPVPDLWAAPATRVILQAPGIDSFTEHLSSTGATITPAGTDWLDATAPKTSKATALEALRERLGIPGERTVAVGDGANDTDMLRWAGRGIAMGHAASVVRHAADEVTGTITDGGVVPALHSLLPDIANLDGLSPLAAQLATAAHTSPRSAVVRVLHDHRPGVSRCEVWTLRAGAWVRHAPIPSGTGATMRAIETAARDAGLGYPRGNIGRRRAHWRSSVSGDGPAGFELPLTGN